MKPRRFRRACEAPVRLGDALQDFLKQSGLDRVIREQDVILQWPEIAGEAVAKHAIPIEFRGGVLFLTVDNATWRSQLHFLKEEMMEKINAFAQRKIVKNIMFQ